MRALVGAVIAVIGVALVTTCGDDSEPVGPNGGAGLVRGTVTQLKTGDGVANLVMALVGGGQVLQATPTDAAGNFEFSGVAAGPYTVRLTGLELAGVISRNTSFEPEQEDIVVADATVDMSFAAVGLIPPRVVGDVSCGGSPVAGASIRVIGGAADTIVTTNPQGRYGATDLDSGNYAVILVDAPCAMDPAFQAVFILPGQAVEADFEG